MNYETDTVEIGLVAFDVKRSKIVKFIEHDTLPPDVTAMFISCDPLQDMCAWITPYHYCSNNPINRTDPTGMLDDEWEVNKTNGKMTNVKSTPNDVIYITEDGKRTGKSISFEGRVMSKREGSMGNGTFYTDLNFKDATSGEKTFDFLADHTEVEWSKLVSTSESTPDRTDVSIHTSHMRNEEQRGPSLVSFDFPLNRRTLIEASHSHSDSHCSSVSDRNFRDNMMKYFPKADFMIRFQGRNRSYKSDNWIDYCKGGFYK